jgi:hypothetical protein
MVLQWSKLIDFYMKNTLILLMLFMAGCGGCEEKKPLQQAEINPVSQAISVSFYRLDDDLFSADFSQPELASQQLHRKYGEFYCRFVEDDLRLAPCHSDSVGKMLVPFVTSHDIVETRKEINNIFTSEKMAKFNNALTEAMRKWNHYFPDSLVPGIVYYQSAWNSNIHATDSVIGISLDTYLGADNKITQQLSSEFFPRYMKENMDEKYMVADAVKGWIAWKSRGYYEKRDLLSELVFFGKLMYMSEALIPDMPDTLLMSWSSMQYEWALSHELNVWKTVANERVMYQSKSFEINKWFADGPFTGSEGVPQESPPQLGVWLGWSMVRQYMEKNPAITMTQLLAEKDYQKILSAYTPRR